MKKIYTIGLLATAVVAGCTPETAELKVLRVEQPAQPTGIPTTPVDLSNTVVTFLTQEQAVEVYRDSDTKLIEDGISFEFAPIATKRQLKIGEDASVQIIPITSQYERVLPEASYSIDVNQVTLLGADKFKVSLKTDAFKELDITKEYSLLFKLKILSTTPADVPVITAEKEEKDIYRIKLKFTEEKYPQGDNIEVETSPTTGAFAKNTYTLESNYQPSHLSKIKDGSVVPGVAWWVDTNLSGDSKVYLNITFTEEKTIKGIKFTSGVSRKMSNLKELTVTALPKGAGQVEYVQGVYTTTRPVSTIYIKFKEPIKTKMLRLDNFKALSGQYVDFYEIDFY